MVEQIRCSQETESVGMLQGRSSRLWWLLAAGLAGVLCCRQVADRTGRQGWGQGSWCPLLLPGSARLFVPSSFFLDSKSKVSGLPLNDKFRGVKGVCRSGPMCPFLGVGTPPIMLPSSGRGHEPFPNWLSPLIFKLEGTDMCASPRLPHLRGGGLAKVGTPLFLACISRRFSHPKWGPELVGASCWGQHKAGTVSKDTGL